MLASVRIAWRSLFWTVLVLLAIAGAPPASAQSERPVADQSQANGPIRVGTRVIPPLVIEENDKLTGFSIDLWDGITERLNLESQYVPLPDVKSQLNAVGSGDVRLGISAISITAERERTFEFSLPMMNAGLQILVRGAGAGGGSESPVEGLMRTLISPVLLLWLGIAAILVIVPAHLLWFFERNHENGIIPQRSYFPGIFHAMWWATSTLAAQADQMPRHWMARVLAVLWMFVGIVFVAYYTAQLTASLTVQEMRGGISGPADLPGKKVATTRGSTAAAFLNEQRAQVHEVTDIKDAFQKLLDGDVAAVVFDAPVLLHFAAHEGAGRTRVVGPVFRQEDYGIVFMPGDPLRRKVNTTLLSMKEDGTYQRLYDKWFGEK